MHSGRTRFRTGAGAGTRLALLVGKPIRLRTASMTVYIHPSHHPPRGRASRFGAAGVGRSTRCRGRQMPPARGPAGAVSGAPDSVRDEIGDTLSLEREADLPPQRRELHRHREGARRAGRAPERPGPVRGRGLPGAAGDDRGHSGGAPTTAARKLLALSGGCRARILARGVGRVPGFRVRVHGVRRRISRSGRPRRADAIRSAAERTSRHARLLRMRCIPEGRYAFLVLEFRDRGRRPARTW